MEEEEDGGGPEDLDLLCLCPIAERTLFFSESIKSTERQKIRWSEDEHGKMETTWRVFIGV